MSFLVYRALSHRLEVSSNPFRFFRVVMLQKGIKSFYSNPRLGERNITQRFINGYPDTHNYQLNYVMTLLLATKLTVT